MGMRPKRDGLGVVSLVWLVMTVSPCNSTTIVAMRTPEVVALAADTAATFKGGGQPDTQAAVSKIGQQGQVLYALSGFVKDPRGLFDPAAMIAATFHEAQPFLSAVAHLEAHLARALTAALLYLRTDEPALFRQAITAGTGGTTVFLASFEHGVPLAVSLTLRGAATPTGDIHIDTQRRACPGADCPEGRYTFLLGRHKAIEQYFATHTLRLAMRPEEAVRFLVQLEIDAKTPGVAPPIEVVRLSQDGIHWLAQLGTRSP